jgi:hypothetical protein
MRLFIDLHSSKKILRKPKAPWKTGLILHRNDIFTAMTQIDETWPIINKPKHHPKTKRGIQGTKWKDPCPRRQKNHLRGQTTRGTSSPKPPITRRISNNEKEGLLKAHLA